MDHRLQCADKQAANTPHVHYGLQIDWQASTAGVNTTRSGCMENWKRSAGARPTPHLRVSVAARRGRPAMPQTRVPRVDYCDRPRLRRPFDNEFDEVATALDLRSICQAENDRNSVP